MEKDGITRVYITSTGDDAREVYPTSQPFDRQLEGNEAKEALSRADYLAVNSEKFELDAAGNWGKKIKDEWLIAPKPGSGETFTVDRRGWSKQERHSRLARELEKVSGKKGLTIVTS